jgi:hypothetical protein
LQNIYMYDQSNFKNSLHLYKPIDNIKYPYHSVFNHPFLQIACELNHNIGFSLSLDNKYTILCDNSIKTDDTQHLNPEINFLEIDYVKDLSNEKMKIDFNNYLIKNEVEINSVINEILSKDKLKII